MSKFRADILEQAKQIRAATQQAASALTDEAAAEMPRALYDAWSADSVPYIVGDIRQDDGALYRCLQAHTSQANWKPANAPSIWVKIADPLIEYPEWSQPTDATNAYYTGDKMTYTDGKKYICTAPEGYAVTFGPDVLPEYWQEVT